jgi:probable rRNA maturation factor
MAVGLRNVQKRIVVPWVRLKPIAQALLETVGCGEGVLSVLLTDDRQMARLHQRWMGEGRSTDVLSFPLRDKGSPFAVYHQRSARRGPSPIGCRQPPAFLGDIVISLETVARRSPDRVLAEVVRCLIHGLLHLVGYDHVRTKDRQRMNRQTRRLMKSVSEWVMQTNLS